MNDLPKDLQPKWPGTAPLICGIVALLLLIGGLGAWSVKARLSGAVVAPGLVQVERNRQVVQHPDGGVVGEILVKDSDRVDKGDILIRLDGRRQKSELSIIEGQLREIAARASRLRAERDDLAGIDFGPELTEMAETDPAVDSLLKGERTLFIARREAMEQETELLHEKNRQIENRIEGIGAQLDAMRQQEELLKGDLADQQALLAKQLTQSSRVSELLRETANLSGQIGRSEAEVAELKGQVASNDIALLQLSTRRREEAVSMLRDLQFREIELTERQIVLQDTLTRLDIRSPTGGIIYGMQVFAEQSVVQPAQPLMYIIPQDEPLVAQARVEAINIDEVYVGQDASLRFSAFDQRQIPEIGGQVKRISADVLKDDNTGLSYYSVDIQPLDSELGKLGKSQLLPGMPVEAFIRTGERTPLAYLLEPLTSFFGRAMRE